MFCFLIKNGRPPLVLTLNAKWSTNGAKKEKLPVRVRGILDMSQPVWAKQKQERVTLPCPQEDVDSVYSSLWLVPTPPDCLTIQADSLHSQQGGGG